MPVNDRPTALPISRRRESYAYVIITRSCVMCQACKALLSWNTPTQVNGKHGWRVTAPSLPSSGVSVAEVADAGHDECNAITVTEGDRLTVLD